MTETERYAKLAEPYVDLAMLENGPDAETAILDLLADLMHYCDQHKVSFEYCLDRATKHHEWEVDNVHRHD